MASVANVRQGESRHSHEPVHVRAEHGRLVVLGRLGERVPPERKAGVVEQDVDAAELLDRLGHEATGARRIGDVELERHVCREAVDPARAAGYPDARVGKGTCRC